MIRSIQSTCLPPDGSWQPALQGDYKHRIFFHKPFIKWLLYIQTNIYPK